MMNSILGNFKKFDAHVKTIDGVNQRTILGALLTVSSIIFVFFLIYTETKFFMSSQFESHMVTDFRGSQESLHVTFDVTFPLLKCPGLTFVQEVTRGTVHSHESQEVNKLPTEDGLGCSVAGHFATDKIGGNFRLEYRPAPENQADEINISHRITQLLFMPLNRSFSVDNQMGGHSFTAPVGPGIHQYVVQVVTTHTKRLMEVESFKNEFYITERHVYADQFDFVESIGGHSAREFLGVMFSYDFSPVILVRTEKRGDPWEFATSLCGIVGGVITVLGLVDRLLHSSAKALIGKKD